MQKATICVLLLLSIASSIAIEMDLTAENVRSVLSDFANELSKVQSEALDDGGRRRSLLSIKDAFTDSPFLDNFDLDVSLSDFIDGVLQTPIFDFVSEIPQSEAGWEEEIKSKYKEFCNEPEKESGEILLESCEGPEITFELVPGVCTVIDRYDRSIKSVFSIDNVFRVHHKFECEPPRLEYKRTGPVCTSSFREAAHFIDKECKFVQQLGEEKELILGGGTHDTSLRFGKQNLDAEQGFDVSEIKDVISGLFSDLADFPDVSHITSPL